MTRFAYAEATIIVLGQNREFTASVTLGDTTFAYRTPEDPATVVEWTVEHTWQEGKKWHLVTTEVGEITVQRTGGCGCQ